MSKIEINLQFPFDVSSQNEHRKAAYTIYDYNTTVNKNRSIIALNVDKEQGR